MGSRIGDESGAVLLTVSLGLVAILAIAALVLDLGAVRSNRAASSLAADAAGGNGLAGCETALSYLELNLPGVTTLTGASCLSFPTSCDDTTPVSTTTGTAGDWVATITYPVPDGNPLLDPSAIGASTQAIVADRHVRGNQSGHSRPSLAFYNTEIGIIFDG